MHESSNKLKLSSILTGIVLVLGIIIIFLVNLTQQKISSTYTHNLPLIQVSDNLKYKTTVGHLWFEEYMAGDESINPEKDVISRFESSSKILRGILDGSETELGKFQKIEDADMKAVIRKTLEEIDALKQFTQKRWHNKLDRNNKLSTDTSMVSANIATGEEAGGDLDQQFDASFEKIQASLDEFKKLVSQKVVQDISGVHTLSISASGLLAAIFLGIAYMVFRFQRKNEQLNEVQTARMEQEKIKLEKMTVFADSIGQGNYDHTLTINDHESDSLAQSLINMKEKLQSVMEEDQKRNWANIGMAKMSEIIRNDNNTEVFYFNIITFIIRYLNANQGGLFVVNNQDDQDIHIELKACLAYEKRKFIQKRIEIGEGLVGRCMQEAASIYMTQIPKNYITINSGLGEANPGALLIMPLKINNEIFGVVEIASFIPFEKHEIDFVEKISETVAAAISEVKGNEQTKILLGKAQQQAEELRAQEEEMRQNMEELSATQEEMRRKENEYIQLIDKLKQQEQIN